MKIIIILLMSFLGLLSGKFLDQSVKVDEWENLVFGGYLPPLTKFSNVTESRIVGGIDAAAGAFPYQISLQVRSGSTYYHTCGGSILSTTKIACAAHCCVPYIASNLRVVAGAQNMQISEPSQQISLVSKLTVNTNYNSETIENDSCKIFLQTPLTFNAYVASIPTCKTEPLVGAACVATGWGKTDSAINNLPVKLQQVTLNIIDRKKCIGNYNGINIIVPSMICAGNGPSKGGCNGDSGGPLVCNVGGKKCLAGCTSWGVPPCGREQYPTVYTNVANLESFYASST